MYANGLNENTSAYQISRSSNYGSTWADINLSALGITTPPAFVDDIQVSPDGQYVVFYVQNSSADDNLYLSTDYGVTFSVIYTSAVVQGCSVSQYGGLITVRNNTSLLTSTDLGVNWVNKGNFGGQNIHCSYNGQYQLSSQNLTNFTTDSWTTSNAGPTTSFNNDISANGSLMLFAATNAGATSGVRISTDYGSTFTLRRPIVNTQINGISCAKLPWI